MGFLQAVCGPNKDEVWGSFAHEIGAEHVPGTLTRSSKVVSRFRQWPITLDTYVVPVGKVLVTYTRVQAPFLHTRPFSCTIAQRGVLSALGALLGMQDPETGYPEVDARYVVRSSDLETARAWLSDPALRELICDQPRLRLEIRDRARVFESGLPEGVSVMVYQESGVIKDPARLEALFSLFERALAQLAAEDLAYDGSGAGTWH